MDDSYTDTVWNSANASALLDLTRARQTNELQTHQVELDPDTSLWSIVSSLRDTCVKRFYMKQFGFMEDHVRPSTFYRTCLEIEKLQSELYTDREFAKMFFGRWIQSTGKGVKNNKMLRRLRNHDIPFIVEKIEARTPSPPRTTNVTIKEYRTEYGPRIVADKSIKYSAKKLLVELFPENVTYNDLEKWDIEPPDVEVILPEQFYQRFHFGTWITGFYDDGTEIKGLSMDDISIVKIETLVDGIRDTEEWKGRVAFQYDVQNRLHDFRTSRQREDDREDEKITLATFVRQLLNLQLVRQRKAFESYNLAKLAVQKTTNDELSSRDRRRHRYAKIYTAIAAMHSKKNNSNYNRILRSSRKTYLNWAMTYDIPFEFLSAWKADRDVEEEMRRNAEGIGLDTSQLGGISVVPDGAYHLLFTLEDQLNKQLANIDEVFRQKTGYVHPVSYLTDVVDGGDATFNAPLQAIIDKRLSVAAQLGIVQDKIQEIEGGYIMGSVADKVVSGNTFIKDALEKFLPHAYAQLSAKFNEDRRLNKQDHNIETAKALLISENTTLTRVENHVTVFIKKFYSVDFELKIPEQRIVVAPSGRPSDIDDVEGTAPGDGNTDIFELDEETETDLESLESVFGPVAIAAHYVERCAVEGGMPDRFEEFNIATTTIQKFKNNLSSHYIKEIIPKKIDEHLQKRMEEHPIKIGSSVAKNRYEKGYIQLLKKHFCTSSSKTFKKYDKLLVDSVQKVNVLDNMHLPVLIESIIPEAVSMIDLFEDSIAKAAASIQENMTRESVLPDVGKLEAELETERARLHELREKRVSEEKLMTEKFRLSEVTRIEQDRISQEKLVQVNMERIAAEEKRISQEQIASDRLDVEKTRFKEARFEIQQQKIAFQQERLELQQNQFETHSDSVSEASDLDIADHEGWEQPILQDVHATEQLEDEAEEQTIVEHVAQSVHIEEDDNESLFSDFSLDFDSDN